jgi:excisionase family DNA binding protein
MSPVALPGLIRVEAVAQVLGLSRPMIYKLVNTGELPTVRIGKTLRFDPADVAAFIQARRAQQRDRVAG